ncbi:MAG TPA: MAE_28990/MAE_18760 family HEPN-like nuclease [Fimbriimonas sp.]|nr:MAE_28990/MAE_18760 family HEPN-like nuclease [Fimbriimonas sp.]
MSFEERKIEILSYLDLVEGLEEMIKNGCTVIQGGSRSCSLSPDQQRMLYAGVYIQLYNLIESTVTLLLNELEATVSGDGTWDARALTDKMRREWIKSIVADKEELQANDTRLTRAIQLSDHFIGNCPLKFRVPRGGGGNWNDEAVSELATRLGVTLTFPSEATVKRFVRNGQTAMKLVTTYRNKLAHGQITFGECGADHDVSELRNTAAVVFEYLERMLSVFTDFIDNKEFLEANSSGLAASPP